MPAICDLDGVGQSARGCLTVAAAAIARHDLDPGMPGKPGLDRRDLAVGQELHDPAPLQIADDRSIAMISAKGPVIDPDGGERLGSRAGLAPHDTQQGVIADGQHQPLGEAGRRPTPECQSEMMDEAFEPSRPPGSNRKHIIPKALGEDAG